MKVKVKFFEMTASFYEKIHFSTKQRTVLFFENQKFFKPTDFVLDLAGGTGRIAQTLVGKVKEITVVDASQKMLNQCKNKIGVNCVFGLAEQIPFPDSYFDKIIIIDAFHHIQDREKAILEIKRVLKSDGKILIEEVNPKRIFGYLLKVAEKFLAMGSTFYSLPELKKLFIKFDLKVEAEKFENSFYNLIIKK